MIILFGIAGSGKGTQAEILSKRLNCPTLSSGEVLRQNKNNPKILDALSAGKLVDDEIIMSLLEDELTKIHADTQEFVLDGTPRSINQAQWLVDKIKNGKLHLTAIININLSMET
jgi:adenylate kinase